MSRTRREFPIRKVWLSAGGVFLFLMVWVGQSVHSTKLSYQIQKVEEEIRKEQRTQTELELQRDRALSLESLEVAAQRKLGLVIPAEKNVVIVALAR